jgi:hypothetical protein
MNWLPSLRALMIFAILLVLFAAAYWACAGHVEKPKASGSIRPSPCLRIESSERA